MTPSTTTTTSCGEANCSFELCLHFHFVIDSLHFHFVIDNTSYVGVVDPVSISLRALYRQVILPARKQCRNDRSLFSFIL